MLSPEVLWWKQLLSHQKDLSEALCEPYHGYQVVFYRAIFTWTAFFPPLRSTSCPPPPKGCCCSLQVWESSQPQCHRDLTLLSVFSVPQIWDLAIWFVQEVGHSRAKTSAFLWDVPGISQSECLNSPGSFAGTDTQ